MTRLKQRNKKLTLNIAPISFSKDQIVLGRIKYRDKEHYEALRNQHRQTHAFRFDSRSNTIANVTLKQGNEPLGEISTENIHGHWVRVLRGKLR